MDNRPIGFLDSGLGGLTAVKAALKLLPAESSVFIGDQARLPYGPRSPQEIQQFTKQLIAFLITRKVKVVLIACNTATAAALPLMQRLFPIPIFGVIDAGSRQAVRQTKQDKLGLIATQGTINSQAYEKKIQQLAPQLQICGLATPEFVTLVEQGDLKSSTAQLIVQQTLAPLRQQSLDTLILGCTHFPLLAPLIQVAMGPKVQLIDAGSAAVVELKDFLQQQNLTAAPDHLAQHQYYTTGSAQQFNKLAMQWLQQPITVQQVEV